MERVLPSAAIPVGTRPTARNNELAPHGKIHTFHSRPLKRQASPNNSLYVASHRDRCRDKAFKICICSMHCSQFSSSADKKSVWGSIPRGNSGVMANTLACWPGVKCSQHKTSQKYRGTRLSSQACRTRWKSANVGGGPLGNGAKCLSHRDIFRDRALRSFRRRRLTCVEAPGRRSFNML